MTNRVLVDTGPLVAILVPADPFHAPCTRILGELRQPLLTCWPVLTEAAWLVRKQVGGVSKLLGFVENRVVEVGDLGVGAATWIARFLDRYESLGAQLADAALAYLAEREDLETVFRLDRRDFLVYRRSNGGSFRLLPE